MRCLKAFFLLFLAISHLCADYVCVSSMDDGTVVLIDSETNSVTKVISNMGSRLAGVGATVDGKHLYVSNYSANSVFIIDMETYKTIKIFNNILGALGFGFSSDGQYAYVTGATRFNGTITVINAKTGEFISTITKVGDGPSGIAISQDGKRAYVANYFEQTISVVDLKKNTVEATITVEKAPRDIAIMSSEKYGYVTNFASNSVSVVNLKNQKVEKTISLGKKIGPWNAVITPNSKYVYVTDRYSNSVTVIETAKNTIVTTIANVDSAPNNLPSGIACSQDGQYVYVTNLVGNSVAVIDTNTNKVIKLVPKVGKDPIAVTTMPDIDTTTLKTTSSELVDDITEVIKKK